MKIKRTREENELAIKGFIGKIKSTIEKLEIIRHYTWLLLYCLVVISIGWIWLDYSPILFSTMLFCFLAISVCYFIPQFKKYISLLDLASIILSIISLQIVGILKGKSSSYIYTASILLLVLGGNLRNQTLISISIRKWLIFLIILLNVGLLVYVHDNPKLNTITLLPALVFNIIGFIGINEQERKEKQKEIEQLKQSQTQAKLSSLKDQLSPHFLFNTLNTITSISQEQTVKDFVDEVANIYRYVLQYKEVDSVTIRQEIEFINSYLFILKSRLEGGIDFYVNIKSERIMDTKIPPLTLQMLVENAVKHNITSIDNPLYINIFVVDGSLLVIQNNYQPKISVIHSNQTGLKNIAERYRLLYKKEIIVENKNGFFTVKLPIVIA